ncbi:MAG: methyltransferase domain-containing protein [Halofilum sp. (in: g-proteobacteria)]|nr:methyltransferase domain-containing protein [Halofilum sp. (in: g-proteobacteria)]
MDDTSRDHLHRVYEAGDLDALAAGYAAWAEQYDRDVMAMGYQTPGIVAGMVGRHLAREAAPTLDCGAGTGLMGLLLAALGYRQLAAMDMSEDMLAVARRRQCYDDVRRQVLGEPLDYPDGRFAAAVAAGVFTLGHAPAGAYDEIVRVLQPGGVFVVSERVDGDANRDYRERREALAAAGAWHEVEASEQLTPFPLAPEEAEVQQRVYVYRRA